MNVCALQLNVKLGDRPHNFANAKKYIAMAMQGSPDTLVLPELWDLVFYPANARELGDEGGEQAKAFLSTQAKEYGVNIVGGSIVRKCGGKIWNTSYVMNRQGECIAAYDKMHLFSPAGEHELFEAGEHIVTYDLDGIRAGSILCYDIRFCELPRSIALQGAKILFVPAAWPHPRLSHWQCLAQARAIENQFFVVAVNLSGTANNLKFCGHSAIINPWGDAIDEAGEGEQLVIGECDFGIVDDIRSRMNVFRDRRPGYYQILGKR